MDLHDAAGAGDLQKVRELLDGGADVDALDDWENTPLLLACFSEQHHPEVVALLRERGARPGSPCSTACARVKCGRRRVMSTR